MSELSQLGKNKIGRELIYNVIGELVPPVESTYNKLHPLLRRELFESPENVNSSKYFKIQDPSQLISIEEEQNVKASSKSGCKKCTIVGNTNIQDILVGELFGMCSREEMINKQQTSTANDFERLSGLILKDDTEARIVNSHLAVKSFQRSDASRVFKKEFVRSVVWCRMVVRRLIVYFMEADRQILTYLYYKNPGFNNYRYIDIYNFLRDRLRAVWQDLTVQHANRHRGSIECYEISFRFLLLSEELLCNVKEFNSVQNSSLMSTCLGKLMSGYQDVEYSRKKFGDLTNNLEFMNILVYDSPYQAEFWSYRILTSMNSNTKGMNSSDTRIIDIINSLSPKLSENPLVKLSLEIHCSFRLLNIVRYFRYFRKCIDIINLLLNNSDRRKLKNNAFRKYSHSLILICILIKKYSNIIRLKYLDVLLSSSMTRRQCMPLWMFMDIFGIYIESIGYLRLFIERFGIYIYEKNTPNTAIFDRSGTHYSSIEDLVKDINYGSKYIVSFKDCVSPSSIESLNTTLDSLNSPSEALSSLFNKIRRIDILDPISGLLLKRDIETRNISDENTSKRLDISGGQSNNFNSDIKDPFGTSLTLNNRNIINSKGDQSANFLIKDIADIDINKYKETVSQLDGASKIVSMGNQDFFPTENVSNLFQNCQGSLRNLQTAFLSPDDCMSNETIPSKALISTRNKRSIDQVDRDDIYTDNSDNNKDISFGESGVNHVVFENERNSIVYGLHRNNVKKRMFCEGTEGESGKLFRDNTKPVKGGVSTGEKAVTWSEEIENVDFCPDTDNTQDSVETFKTINSQFDLIDTKNATEESCEYYLKTKGEKEEQVFIELGSGSAEQFEVKNNKLYSNNFIEDDLVGISSWRKQKPLFNYQQTMSRNVINGRKCIEGQSDSEKVCTGGWYIRYDKDSREFYINSLISSLNLPLNKNGINLWLESSVIGIIRDIRRDIISNILESLSFSFIFFYNQTLPMNGISRLHINSLNSFYTKMELMLSNITGGTYSSTSNITGTQLDEKKTLGFVFPWNSAVVESELHGVEKKRVIIDLYQVDFNLGDIDDENRNKESGIYGDVIGFRSDNRGEVGLHVPIHVEMMSIWMNYSNSCMRNRLFSETDISTINKNISLERENSQKTTFESMLRDYLKNNGDVVVWTLPFLVRNEDVSNSDTKFGATQMDPNLNSERKENGEEEDYLEKSLGLFALNMSTNRGKEKVIEEFTRCCNTLNIKKYLKKDIEFKIPLLKTITLVFSFVAYIPASRLYSTKDDFSELEAEICLIEDKLSSIIRKEFLNRNEQLVITDKSDSVCVFPHSFNGSNAKLPISHYSGMSCNFKFICMGLAPLDIVDTCNDGSIVVYAPGVNSIINTKLSFGCYSNNIRIFEGQGCDHKGEILGDERAKCDKITREHCGEGRRSGVEELATGRGGVIEVSALAFATTLLVKGVENRNEERDRGEVPEDEFGEFCGTIKREESEISRIAVLGPGIKYDSLFSLFKYSLIRGFSNCFMLFTSGGIDWILLSNNFTYNDIKDIIVWIYHFYVYVMNFFDDFNNNRNKYVNCDTDQHFFPNGSSFISDISMLRNDTFLARTTVDLLNLFNNWTKYISRNWNGGNLHIPSIIWNVMFDYFRPIRDLSCVQASCGNNKPLLDDYSYTLVFELMKDYLFCLYIEYVKTKENGKGNPNGTNDVIVCNFSDNEFINYIDKELLSYKVFNFVNRYKLDNY